MRPFVLASAAVLLWQAAAMAAPADGVKLDVTVVDQSNEAIPGVRVEVRQRQEIVASAETDPAGKAEITDLEPGRYELTASREGFEPARKSDVELSQSVATTIEFTLAPPLATRESVEVTDKVAPVEEGSSPAQQVAPQAAKQLPGNPATVSDVLPLLPGVVRRAGGGLILSASGEHRSAMIVNSADVTDPATGQFGLTVPIDSVERLDFYQTPFLAEYGRFTAGLVSVETRRGGDKWKWELNDPLPDFAIRSYHLRGLRDATPRLNVEGPLIPGKLYFSEGFEYEIRKTLIYELPFPYNQKKTQGFNSFAQFDWIVSDKQLVTATVHVAPQTLDFVNMDYYNPGPTTPDASTHNYTATVADRLSFGGGLLENTISATRFSADVWSQGPLGLTMTPQGNMGNYFAQQQRKASRVGWTPVYSFAHRRWLGTHSFKMGGYLAGSTDAGQLTARPVDILDSTGQLIERISFTGGLPFHASDSEYAFFGEDHWMVTPRLAVDMGVRTESQAVSESLRLAPRLGISWTPFPSLGTVMRAGVGIFYDRVPLNIYSFDRYPSQLITMFGPGGVVTAGPFLYRNGLGVVSTSSPWVSGELEPGNFSPRSATGSIQIEQPVTEHLRLRVGYMQNESSGLVILNRTVPDPVTNTGANLLSGGGHSRYRQFETTARVRLNSERELFFSYVRSNARGDLNDFANYLGSFPAPLIRANQFGSLPTNLPNRFLVWGVVPLPDGIRIAPVFEYRTGFPYSALDAAQNYVGIPNSNRFPNFLSLDSRFSKDLKVNDKYSVRLSLSGFNLTNHFNPEAVHWNVDDPAYGYLFGQRGRRFTVDFDVLF